MSITIPFDEPTHVQAGDTVKFYKSTGPYATPGNTSADFPFSEDWTLKYRIVGGSLATPVTVTATEDATGAYLVTIAASDLAAQEVQTVARLMGWFENTGATTRYTIYDAPITLLPNAATATATELKTHAATMLDLINARLEGRMAAGADFERYGLAGREVEKIPAAELLRFRGIYTSLVWKERNPRKAFVTHHGAVA